MTTPEEYYRVSIFIPFIDSIIQQLNNRFNKHREIISGFQALIYCNIKTDLHQFVNFYQNDVECYDNVIIEINLWHRFLKENNIKPVIALDVYIKMSKYQNVILNFINIFIHYCTSLLFSLLHNVKRKEHSHHSRE